MAVLYNAEQSKRGVFVRISGTAGDMPLLRNRQSKGR
ncbi:hypothetical protein ABID20_004141 [Rhizobium alvei]